MWNDKGKDEAPPLSPPKRVGQDPIIPIGGGGKRAAAVHSSLDSDFKAVPISISDTAAVHLTQAEYNSIIKSESCLGQPTRDQLYEVTEGSLKIPVDDHDPDTKFRNFCRHDAKDTQKGGTIIYLCGQNGCPGRLLYYHVNSLNPRQFSVAKKPRTCNGDGSVKIQGVTTVNCWEKVMNLAKDIAVDAVDRDPRHFIGCLFHFKQSNRRYLLGEHCRFSMDDPLVLEVH